MCYRIQPYVKFRVIKQGPAKQFWLKTSQGVQTLSLDKYVSAYVYSWNQIKTCTTHYPNMSVQYTSNLNGCKNDNVQIKFLDFFLLLLKKTDCGYSLELPHWGSSNEYPQSMFKGKNKKKCIPPVNPTYIKVGCKGFFIIRTC